MYQGGDSDDDNAHSCGCEANAGGPWRELVQQRHQHGLHIECKAQHRKSLWQIAACLHVPTPHKSVNPYRGILPLGCNTCKTAMCKARCYQPAFLALCCTSDVG